MTIRIRRRTVLTALSAMTGLIAVPCPADAASLEALLAPRAELWERWTAHNPASTESIDHKKWDQFLRRHVHPGSDGINRVSYAAVSSDDRHILDSYIADQSAIAVGTLSRHEQFAFWANLYNAVTVRLVLDRWPIKSIRDINISPGLFASGPWDKALIGVENTNLTLNDIEHRILRPIWKDSRIHYAVNCASLGCPNLGTRAFSVSDLDAALDGLAAAYVNHPRGWRIEEGKLIVSKIYSWYTSDFGASETDVIAYLRNLSNAERADLLKERTKVDAYTYDWAVNSAT